MYTYMHDLYWRGLQLAKLLSMFRIPKNVLASVCRAAFGSAREMLHAPCYIYIYIYLSIYIYINVYKYTYGHICTHIHILYTHTSR